MSDRVDLNTLLVPVDFSPNSIAALQQALDLARGEHPVVILLHAIDPELLDFAESFSLGERAEIAHKMREQAEAQLRSYAETSPDDVEVDPIVSEGPPFLEILKKADDFAVDAIVMSKTGRFGKMEDLLFGSTAEKVIRCSRRPVLVLPSPS